MNILPAARAITKIIGMIGARAITSNLVKAATPQTTNVIKTIVYWVGGTFITSAVVNVALREVDLTFDSIERIQKMTNEIPSS